jgi:predicted lipoprotein with Yx(FWY)xxD motif
MQTKLIAVAVVVVGLIAAATAVALSGGSSSSKSVVGTRTVMGKKVLVTRSGMTLYSLSAEKNGRFICSNKACLALWHPLTVAKGTKPTGAHNLGTIRRPDGHTQVTYNHKPLYTFVQDKKPGDAKGEGFKDVGTWHVASTRGTTQTPQRTSTMPSYPSY